VDDQDESVVLAALLRGILPQGSTLQQQFTRRIPYGYSPSNATEPMAAA
jgi:hypothetical protein